MNALLKHIILEPDVPAEASIIWFHGLGADGNDFVPIVPQLALPKTLPMRFIFPHAPVIPVTINGGYPMPAWFDITALEPELNIDEKGLKAAIKAAHDLIQAEVNKGIPATRIILAGFSQGGAIALSAALAYTETLAGVIALSTFIPPTQLEHIPTAFQDVARRARNRATECTNQYMSSEASTQQSHNLKDEEYHRFPIYMAHGSLDPIVPLSLGEQTYSLLKQGHFNVDWNVYTIEHQVCKDEIDSISQWIQKSLMTTSIH